MSYLIRNVRSLSSPSHYARHLMPSISARYKSAQIQMQPLKSMDDIPGGFEWNDLSSDEQVARTEFITEKPFEYFEQQYQIAKKVDANAPMYKSSIVGMDTVSLLSHDLVKQWQEYELRGKMQRNFNDHFINLFGKTFSMAGKEHTNWRQKAAKGFKPQIINNYSDFIQSAAQDIVFNGIYEQQEADNDGGYVQLYEEAKKFSYHVGTKFTVGPLLDDKEREYVFPLFREFVAGFSPEAFTDMEYKDPESAASKAVRARDKLIGFLTPKYRKAVELMENDEWENEFGPDNDCLVKGLIEHDGFNFGPRLWEEHWKVQTMIALIFASYDTTASTIANMVYAMNKHPKETNQLRDYIRAHPVLSDPETRLDLDLLTECDPLNCFIDEINRLYGIVPIAIRQVRAEEGCDFGGYLLPKDTFVTIPIRWLHQGDGSWSDDALEFNPERHNAEKGNKNERGDVGRYNNIPFMTGIHRCLGIHLAKHELRMYTLLLLRDWEFEVDQEKSTGKLSFEGFPHYDVWMKLARRSN